MARLIAVFPILGVGILWAWSPGRMTGGGSVFRPDGSTVDSATLDKTGRVTHGFELHCQVDGQSAPPLPNNLEVNWKDANGQHHFHLDVLTSADCFFNPAWSPLPPYANFNTMVGQGTGKLDGHSGATIQFTFVDAGEPGTSDTANYHITDSNGNPVLDVPPCSSYNPSSGACFLTFGNQQAHDS